MFFNCRKAITASIPNRQRCAWRFLGFDMLTGSTYSWCVPYCHLVFDDMGGIDLTRKLYELVEFDLVSLLHGTVVNFLFYELIFYFELCNLLMEVVNLEWGLLWDLRGSSHSTGCNKWYHVLIHDEKKENRHASSLGKHLLRSQESLQINTHIFPSLK